MSEPRKPTTLRYFGNYLLLGEIAAGGMGVVYRAEQPSANRSVALKMIRAGALATPAEIRRFRTEAEAAAGLNHPNIVKIFEIGEHAGQPFFSMELIEGENLAERLTASPSRSAVQEAASLLVKLARAVHHAHQHGILHRDLKPANILLDESGEPHLTDFGLAKCLDAARGQTQTYAVLGTPSYMAPELAAGNARDATIASDVYSLGAVLYELLAGRPPFRGDSAMNILDQVQRFDPPRPRSFVPNLDPDLETICLKCLEREPARRYSSAEGLASDLERWLRGEPIAARPITRAARALKWIRRHPLKAGLAAALAGCLVLTPLAVWQWRLAEAQRSLAAQSMLRGARLEIEQHFDKGDTTLALQGLARLLRQRPQDYPAAERLLNALRQRVFLLPALSAAPGTSNSPPERLAAASPDRRFRAVRADAVNVELIDFTTAQPVRSFRPAHSLVIRHIAFSPDAARFVTASSDGTAKVWNLNSGQPALTLTHEKAVHSAEFSPDGQLLVTASRDRSARLWNISTGQPAGAVMTHPDSVNAARFSPDGRWIVTACDDGLVRLWNAAGAGSGEPARLTNAVEDAWFSDDGATIFASTEAGATHAFKPTRGLTLLVAESSDVNQLGATVSAANAPSSEGLRSRLSRHHADEITFLDLSADGSIAITASLDKTARLWRTRPLEPLTDGPLIHDARVNCARLSPDGKRVVTSTANRKVRVWEVRSGLPLSDWIVSPEPVAGVAFSADDRSVVSSAGWRWELAVVDSDPPPWLADLAEAVAAGDRVALPRIAEELSAAPRDNPIVQWAREFLSDALPANHP